MTLRRVVSRCARRGAPDRIEQVDELVLTVGHAFGVATWEEPLNTHAALLRLWNRWRDEITPRWIEAYPGSRPMAGYLVGEIEPPAWRHELPALRHPIRIGDRGVVIADRAWHMREEELAHLVDIGVVDADERDLAIERLESAQPADSNRYRALFDDR